MCLQCWNDDDHIPTQVKIVITLKEVKVILTLEEHWMNGLHAIHLIVWDH